MRRFDRIVLMMGAALALSMCLFPPWRHPSGRSGVWRDAGYWWLFTGSVDPNSPVANTIDTDKLFMQGLIVVLAVVVLLLAARLRRSRSA